MSAQPHHFESREKAVVEATRALEPAQRRLDRGSYRTVRRFSHSLPATSPFSLGSAPSSRPRSSGSSSPQD